VDLAVSWTMKSVNTARALVPKDTRAIHGSPEPGPDSPLDGLQDVLAGGCPLTRSARETPYG